MNEALLISEKFLKEQTNLSDNLNGKLVLPSIREAQEINLREIIGDVLLDKIKDLIVNQTIDDPENKRFKTLLINCQFFLAYQTASNICIITSLKVDNAGVVRVSDERMEAAPMTDVITLKNYYQNKADFYAKRIQQYILNNSSLYPEINNSNDVKSNLYSSYTSGLWLGGARGRSLPSPDCSLNGPDSNYTPDVNNQVLVVETDNEDQTYNPQLPYTGFAPVTVEGYDVDESYKKLEEI